MTARATTRHRRANGQERSNHDHRHCRIILIIRFNDVAFIYIDHMFISLVYNHLLLFYSLSSLHRDHHYPHSDFVDRPIERCTHDAICSRNIRQQKHFDIGNEDQTVEADAQHTSNASETGLHHRHHDTQEHYR